MSDGESQLEGKRATRPTILEKLRSRIDRWMDSDLIGIPATLYTFFVLVISFLVFRFAGGVAGMVVAIALWIPMVLFAIQGRGKPPLPLGLAAGSAGPRHRVLVVANQGLEDPGLCAEVCRRSERTATEALVIAPVVSSSRLGALADDVDRELGIAQQRLDVAIRSLRREGVRASGRADIADPMESLLDGLREFPPNEILMVPGRETGWEGVNELVERVRSETGLPVTELSGS
jgi:hypothetical protein